MQVGQDLIEKSAVAETVPSATTLKQVVLGVIGALLVIGLVWGAIAQFRVTDPYFQDVLALSGDRVRGEDIFRQNCATCHGLEASGEVGPDLHGVSDRKSRVGLIKQVISGKTPPMPQFQPNVKDMADLLEFLESL
jgi:mono/diheme cytochrome c family protein